VAGADKVVSNMESWENQLKAALYALGSHYAAKMEGEAKNPPYPLRPLTKAEIKRLEKGLANKESQQYKRKKPSKKAEYHELNGGESHLKWRDQTAHARQSIFGEVKEFKDINKLRIRVAHTMEYGEYLELSHQRKYAVLEPVAKKHGPEFIKDAKELIGK